MLQIKTGLTAPEGFLDEVFALDQLTYSPELCGQRENLTIRHNVCPDSFLLVYDDEKLAGYINFFPVTPELNAAMTSRTDTSMRDDDILPPEMQDWAEENHVFIISIVLRPEYQKGEAIILMGNAFLEFLREKDAAGHAISSLSGYAISLGGVKFLKRCRASLLKDTDEGYHFFYATPDDVATLLDEGLVINTYKKSFRDDIFFFIPLTSDGSDGSYQKMLDANRRQCSDEEDFDYTPLEDLSQLDFGDLYCKSLNRHVEYECNGDHFKCGNIKRIYLGVFPLACYDDDYDGIPLATEEAHLFITAHKHTGIYILTLAIKDSQCSPTQLIDQMSTKHLEIEIPETGLFESVEDYVAKHFGLYVCGESKCVVCLEKHPDNELELPYMLSGETMISKHIDYRIRPERRQPLTKNHAVYDYYDSYISRSVIAFVLKDFDDAIDVRIGNEASEIFIVEIVLFQNTAVLRTNRKVVEELCDSDAISNEDINKLYIEFGKTTPFWNTDIFKYPFSQVEADEVIEAFGISQTLEDYYRNQQFLDRLIELKGNIEERAADETMNTILFFLSFFEAGSIILGAVLWIYSILSGAEAWNGNSLLSVITVAAIALGAVFLFFSSRIKAAIRDLKKRRKERRQRRKDRKL